MKRILSVLLFLAFLMPAAAFASDGPYKVVEHDGRYIVSKDGGESQVGGFFLNKEEAQNRANKESRLHNKLKKDKEKQESSEE